MVYFFCKIHHIYWSNEYHLNQVYPICGSQNYVLYDMTGPEKSPKFLHLQIILIALTDNAN